MTVYFFDELENLFRFSAVMGRPLISHLSEALLAIGATIQKMTYTQKPNDPQIKATRKIILMRVTSISR